jgi:hypothetical protein
MKTFDVQGIEIEAGFQDVFDYVAEARNLPTWAHAFTSVSNGRAILQTANGSVEIGLAVHASGEHGTVDWELIFPDGNVARACSRVVAVGTDRSIYTFVLLPPPVPLEQLEGTLEQQSRILREELARLAQILNRG